MKFTEADKEKAENWWGRRNLVKELEYCGEYIKDRRDITNVDLQFYAYIMRKAAVRLRKEGVGNEERAGKA